MAKFFGWLIEFNFRGLAWRFTLNIISNYIWTTLVDSGTLEYEIKIRAMFETWFYLLSTKTEKVSKTSSLFVTGPE